MDRSAFECKIGECQRPLRRFLTALCCGDGALADDLAQDTCVKAYMGIGGLQDDSRFMAWLLRIAYNTYMTHRRSAPQQVALCEADTLPAADTADSRFRYQTLYRALDSLTDIERTSVLLYYMEGYSTAEIATMTDATDAAVRKQLSRARLHLKDLLQ